MLGVECDKNTMSATKTPGELLYCNHCGTPNPPRAVVCCNCGHVHAREIELPPEKATAIVVEQWFWVTLRIVCGVTLCIAGVVPTSGTTLSAALLGRIFGALAIPVVIAAVLGNGNLARSSRWFLGAALVVPVIHYAGTVLSRIRLH